MVAAGCCVELGYPTWEQLIEKLYMELALKICLQNQDVKLAAPACAQYGN
jgi:hypothetical protein